MPEDGMVPMRTVALTLGESWQLVRYWAKELGVRHIIAGKRWYFSPQDADTLRHARFLIRVELYTIKGARRQLELARSRGREVHQTGATEHAGVPIGSVRKAARPQEG